MKRILPATIIVIIISLMLAVVLRHGNDKDFDKINSLIPNERGLQLIIADTKEKREKGLSNFEYLPEDIGMLFVFEQSQKQCMWNKDVKFHIDVAFFDEKWGMINAARMDAHSSKKVCADVPVKYVVEANAGTFVKGNK